MHAVGAPAGGASVAFSACWIAGSLSTSKLANSIVPCIEPAGPAGR